MPLSEEIKTPKIVIGEDLELLWGQCLKEIKTKVSSENYEAWFEPIMPYRLESDSSGKHLEVVVPDWVCYKWLEEEGVLLLKKALDEVLGKGCKLTYRVFSSLPRALQASLYLWRERHTPDYASVSKDGDSFSRPAEEKKKLGGVPKKPKGNRSVYQPHILTVAHYDFTSIQRKILVHVLDQISIRADWQARKQLALWEGIVLEIPLGSFASKDAKQIFEEAEKLASKRIRFEYAVNKEVAGTISLPLLSAIDRSRKKNTLRVSLPEETAVVLFYLGDGFTKYSLSTSMLLASKYSQRLYELCCHWQNRGGFEMPVRRLYRMFKIKKSLQKISFLRDRILDPAREELKKRADIWFEYGFHATLELPLANKPKTSKKGRKPYERVSFKVISKKQPPSGPQLDYQKEKIFLAKLFADHVGLLMGEIEHIVEKLSRQRQLIQAYNRFIRLEKELERGTKNQGDVKRLIMHILSEDFFIETDFRER